MGSFDASRDLELPEGAALRLAELQRRKAQGGLSDSECQELDLLIEAKESLAQLQAKAARLPNGPMPAAANLSRTIRNGLPVMLVPPCTAAIDPEAVRRSLQEEGF